MNTGNLPKLRTSAELENEQPTFLSGDGWFYADTSKLYLDFTKPYTRPNFALSWNGQRFARLGDVQVITGQAGHGKSMLFSQIITAILKGEFGGLRYELSDIIPKPKILLIDTEQSENDVIEGKNRIMDLCDFDLEQSRDDFKIIMLRDTDTALDRWRMTLKAIYEMQPNFVILDGLLDVVKDFNNQEQCAEIIYKCLQVASQYKASMMCVLHQNPLTQKLVGHLGSAAMRKVSDLLAVSKDKSKGEITFKVSQVKARGHHDIDDWQFRVIPTAWGKPEQITSPPTADDTDIFDIRDWLRAGQNEIDWPAWGTAIKGLFRAHGNIKGNDRLQRCFDRALNKRYIVEQPKSEWDKGQKHPKYYLMTDNLNY